MQVTTSYNQSHFRIYGKHVLVIITEDKKEHFLQASSQEDMIDWMHKLEAVISEN